MIRKNRKMTVYKTTGAGYRHIPQIKMQGDWLLKAGFSIGDHIQIKCKQNKLVITKRGAEHAG